MPVPQKNVQIWYLCLLTGILFFFGMILSYPTTTLAKQPSAASLDKGFDPPLGTYYYKVTWGVISAGRAKVQFSRDGDAYKIVAEARAVGGVDKIYRLRYRGESTIDADDLSPLRTVLTSREGRKNKEKVIEYQSNGKVKTTETQSKKGKTPKINSKDHQFDRQVFDPFSAIFLARQMVWHKGNAQEFEVFDGSSHYLIELNAIDKQMIAVAGAQREAWVIVPTVENLTSPEKDSKLESAIIYLSADAHKEILRLESKVFIGKVQVSLDRFEPETEASSKPVTK